MQEPAQAPSPSPTAHHLAPAAAERSTCKRNQSCQKHQPKLVGRFGFLVGQAPAPRVRTNTGRTHGYTAQKLRQAASGRCTRQSAGSEKADALTIHCAAQQLAATVPRRVMRHERACPLCDQRSSTRVQANRRQGTAGKERETSKQREPPRRTAADGTRKRSASPLPHPRLTARAHSPPRTPLMTTLQTPSAVHTPDSTGCAPTTRRCTRDGRRAHTAAPSLGWTRSSPRGTSGTRPPPPLRRQ